MFLRICWTTPRTGDTALAEGLQSYGEPPYKTLLTYAYVMQQYPKIEPPYTRRGRTRLKGPPIMTETVVPETYTEQ